MGQVVLRAKNIYKSYKNGNSNLVVLNDFKLNIQDAEIISIMGQSGSGKSTALNILSTLDEPDSGVVEIMNVNVNDLNEKELSKLRNQKIGFVFQLHHLLPEFNALENVLIPTWIKGKEDLKEKALHLFEFLNLSKRINHLPNQLSGGERSRVALIRGIINEPEILFADEPTGNLDIKNSVSLIDLLVKINKDFGQTIVITTHNTEVASIGDKRYVLEKGRLFKRD